MAAYAAQSGITSDAPAIPGADIIFGHSPAMQRVRLALEQIGDTPVPVLITGESGSGKDLIARLLHRRSAAQPGPFVKVTCPAIPGALLESELFGHEQGAFTGATASRPGRVEQAGGGTLFLDEIGELEMGLQAKLLQLLQDGTYRRLGGRKEMRTQARLVVATNRRLEEDVADGRFRRDLYYRINVVRLELPPLRERLQDILPLAGYFAAQFACTFRRPAPPFSPEYTRALMGYGWPGNVRELENLMQRYVVLGGAAALPPGMAGAAPASATGDGGAVSLRALTRQAVQDLERSVILQSLSAHQWHRKRTARALQISYRALLYKLKETGLQSVGVKAAVAEEEKS
ncbi:MAG: sigma 54-interacting transcriptional regulator [Terriglobales bacterium]